MNTTSSNPAGDTPDLGQLQVYLTSAANGYPIAGASVRVSYTGVPDSTFLELSTDASGQTETIELAAPPLEYSLTPDTEEQPYSEYTLQIEAPAMQPVTIAGTEILPDVKALQNTVLKPLGPAGSSEEVFVIPAHTLYGSYPAKIPEEEIKPTDETGEIVLSRVVVPGVHCCPRRKSPGLHRPELLCQIQRLHQKCCFQRDLCHLACRYHPGKCLAIMSFTLNRVYTEWYRNLGYDFTITSSTAFDHKWIPERNIYADISVIVDELFSNYLSRPGVRQPILTQYCDGRQVQCSGWMTQWGSKALGDQGYSPIQILRYYYGDDLYINTAESISGIPSSWPGSNLEVGSRGSKVRQMQEELNTIAGAYPSLPKIDADGIFGPATRKAVRDFQSVFGLPATGSSIILPGTKFPRSMWESPGSRSSPDAVFSPSALLFAQKGACTGFSPCASLPYPVSRKTPSEYHCTLQPPSGS